MGALEEVKNMQKQGVQEAQIIRVLQEKGIPYREISEALTQSKIRAAVEEEESSQDPNSNFMIPPSPNQDNYNPPSFQEGMPGMEQSIMQNSTQYPSETTQEYMPAPYPQNSQQGDYQSYSYPESISSDTIAEISEQIVAEKLQDVRKHIERVTDFKNIIEAKTESLEERLRRIEKIIDSLQASVIKKIGDYGANIEDIKQEMIETQKTFTKLVPGLKHKTHHSESEDSAEHHGKKHSKKEKRED